MELTLIPEGLTVATVIILLLCSTLTSMITASLGAGGGVLMLVLMALWIPPAAIIPVHGLVQLGSNGGRAVMTWRQADWRVIAAFAPGVVMGAGIGAWLLVDLPAYLWQLTIGVFVLYLCWGPALPGAAFGRSGVFLASALTTFVSLFVGATGPLVAAFIKQMHDNRFTTIATFAQAMVLQHAPKALVFGVAGFVFQEWLVFVVGMILFGLAGTWLGLHALKRLSNRHFHRIFNVLLTLLAIRLLWQAAASSGWLG
ncbi:MAG: sulfite exporter TauE/SafE family protein [Marinobacter sp.]|nr:sulfite exporter TauE/SafE family protein [Marinobacter sp.]